MKPAHPRPLETLRRAAAAATAVAGTSLGAVAGAPVEVAELGEFDRSDPASVAAAFAGAHAFEFGQPWQDALEPGFRGGTVRLGWRGDRLYYFAELEDDRLYTASTGARNQPLWELGDVFELFAGVSGSPGYIEYHSAPDGSILQLVWPSADALGKIAWADAAVKDDHAFASVRATGTGWDVYGEIPASALPGGRAPLAGQTWDINFGRYDSPGPDGEPTLSATSPLTKRSFHRRDEWQQIRFVPRD